MQASDEQLPVRYEEALGAQGPAVHILRPGRSWTRGGQPGVTLKFPEVGYSFYERRLRRNLAPERIPHHIAVMVDGNRRWAKLAGAPTSHGHQAGADKIHEFLGWCEELGVDVVTLYMLSTDNMGRPQEEIDQLLGIIANTVDRLGETNRVRVQPVGALDLLPADLGAKLVGLAESTERIDGLHVNVAVGYGGRREIVDAVKELMCDSAEKGLSLKTLAEELTDQHISSYLYTRGQQDPDLVIRTSGEQRLSGFLMWQSAYSEFYFCEALWPDFRRVDFLRALRDFGRRQRRFGS